MSRDEEGTIDEARFADMVQGALRAHLGENGMETRLEALMAQIHKATNGGRPQLVTIDGKTPAGLNIPSAQALALEILQAVRVALQTARITLIALNDMDTRLRAERHQEASTAPAGSVARLRPDTPGKPAPMTTGTGPAETQGARKGETLDRAESGTEPASQGSPNR